MDSSLILIWLGLGAFLAGIVGAFAFGGRDERLGACICVVGGGLTVLIQALSKEPSHFAVLAVDLGMAIAFGLLAVRTPDKLWPGVAAVAQTLLMAFSASRALHFPLSEAGYIAALNLSSTGVAIALLSGAWAHRRGRKAEFSAA